MGEASGLTFLHKAATSDRCLRRTIDEAIIINRDHESIVIRIVEMECPGPRPLVAAL